MQTNPEVQVVRAKRWLVRRRDWVIPGAKAARCRFDNQRRAEVKRGAYGRTATYDLTSRLQTESPSRRRRYVASLRVELRIVASWHARPHQWIGVHHLLRRSQPSHRGARLNSWQRIRVTTHSRASESISPSDRTNSEWRIVVIDMGSGASTRSAAGIQRICDAMESTGRDRQWMSHLMHAQSIAFYRALHCRKDDDPSPTQRGLEELQGWMKRHRFVNSPSMWSRDSLAQRRLGRALLRSGERGSLVAQVDCATCATRSSLDAT